MNGQASASDSSGSIQVSAGIHTTTQPGSPSAGSSRSGHPGQAGTTSSNQLGTLH